MESQNIGTFGQMLGTFNFMLFGYLAVLYPLALIWFLIFLYKNPTLSQKAMQNIIAVMILFLCVLCLQYLWFQKGELAKAMMNSLEAIVGIFGVYFLLLFASIGSWLLLSVSHFKKTLKILFDTSMRILDIFGKKIVFCYTKFKAFLQARKAARQKEKKQKNLPFNPMDFMHKAKEKPKEDIQIAQPNVRVFTEIKLNIKEPKPEIGLIDTPQVSNQKDYSQEVIERNRLKNGDTQITLTHQENISQKIQEVPSSYPTSIQSSMQEAKEEAKPMQLEEQAKPQEVFSMQAVANHQNTSLQKEQKNEASIKKTAVVKELSENAILLDSLEKGEIEKPKDYVLPSIELLGKNPVQNKDFDESELDEKIQNLLSKLKMFKIDGDIIRTYTGPLVSTFEFKPASHVKVSRILTLSDDLAMALCAQSIRIQAPIPGKDVVGIEIPNSNVQTIYMREILESEVFKNSASPLTLALGKDIVGNPFVTDLKKLPHLLIAGTTGSGKSVGVNAMIVSLLYRNSPENLRLIMVDPKMVEFSMYEDIPHLLTPIITDPKKAITALNSAVREMERRYKLMSALKVKTIENYNQKCKEVGEEPFAFLVIIIDELADLMMTGGKEAEFPITRIAQMGRACGMHLIVATQRPSADVVTGLIKTNLPARVAFKVSNKIDSRVVLDVEGAQSLLGRGDMLFTPPGISGVIRIHAPWTSETEIEKIVESIKAQREVQYDKNFVLEERELIADDVIDESLKSNASDLQKAKEIIKSTGKTSASFLQRRMSVGYNKAATLVEELEKQGFLSAPNAKGIREIIG